MYDSDTPHTIRYGTTNNWKQSYNNCDETTTCNNLGTENKQVIL